MKDIKQVAHGTYQELIAKGYEELKNGNLEHASALFNSIWNAYPQCFVVPFYLAHIALQKDQVELSATLLRDAIRRNSQFTDAMINLGCVYKKQQKQCKARSIFKRAYDIMMNKDDVAATDKSMITSNLASTYIANGTPKEARDLLLEAIEID